MSKDVKEPHKLVFIMLDDPHLVEELIMGLVDIGVKGATVVDSRGMGEIIRQDMPVFAGLASLFPHTNHNSMVLSVMSASLVNDVFELTDEVVGHLEGRHSAICFSVPVDDFRGIKR